MALHDFQTALGRLVRVSAGAEPLCGLNVAAGERAWLAMLVESAGFRFTVDVQRSWCASRAARAARLTLSIIPTDERRRLVDKWVSAGGGTASFLTAEADAFLDFLAEHLPDPSPALILCRVEQATLRASEGAGRFIALNPSRLEAPGCVLRTGQYATLLRFHAEPSRLLAALLGEQPLPPLTPEAIPLLFGPGLEGLCRVATDAEVALWERLVVPVTLRVLLREGHRRETIAALVQAGGAEYLALTQH